MSNPYVAPTWSPPPPGVPPEGPDTPRSQGQGGNQARTFVGIGLGIFVVVLLVAGATGLDVVGSPPHPQAWDPRIADLADFVQDERGLSFDEPVYVDFLPEDEFVETVTGDDADLTGEDRAAIEDSVAELRALGLVEGDFDLFAEQNELQGDSTLAYYSPETERITVRGTEMTPFLRAVIVHELTHALQDQHFDLDAVREKVGEDGDLRFRAVVEGDASNVEDAYVAGLSAADQHLYSSAERDQLLEGDTDPDGTAHSPVLSAFLGAPYAFGPVFVRAIQAEEGNSAIDRAIQDPPTSEAALFDPNRFLDDIGPEVVDTPTVDDGQEILDDGEFGAFSWFVMLASRLDGRDALTFVDGWAGDSYVSYRDGDRICVKARYKATTDADAVFATELLDEWVAAMPAGAASVEDLGDRELQLSSCDPGTAVASSDLNDVTEALGFPVVRLTILAGTLGQADGIAFDEAWCYADHLVDQLTLDQLASDVMTSELERAVTDAASSCLN